MFVFSSILAFLISTISFPGGAWAQIIPKEAFNLPSPGLQIKRDGNSAVLPISRQSLDDMNIQGFVPVIMEITPATSEPLTI